MTKVKKSLVIVESPTKAKTIAKFLGGDFAIESSFGHIRDLPKSKLGVDVDNNFQPQYVIPTKARKNLNALKKIAKTAPRVILATDEDREGEAIAWHLTESLEIPHDKYERIVFHEITEEAIKEALEHPRKLDLKLVDAQQARRILDRLVGYKLSPLLWAKIRKGLSAGRVQSATLRLIVEREREIQAFKPTEYWSVTASLSKQGDAKSFTAKLNKVGGKSLDKLAIKNETEAKEITDALNGAVWQVSNIETKEVIRNPAAPFTTSTLQQEANRKLGFSAKQTMMIAQQLYEGIELGEHGHTGLITYMRTDSVNLSNQALEQAKAQVEKMFGKEYVLAEPRKFKTKSKGAQEAHEAIRPTALSRTPEDIKSHLDRNQFRLYELIWKRTIATQMPEAKFKATGADISTGTKYEFRATGQVLVFDGFLKVYIEGTDEEEAVEEGLLPELSEKEILKLLELKPNQHFTLPPPRFTDASIVKALEEFGIGRPSTYAPTIATLMTREYITREQRKLVPTEIGFVVNDFLHKHFPEIVDYEFTAHMEEELDQVAEGQMQWQPIIHEFYDPFAVKITEKADSIEKIEGPIGERERELTEAMKTAKCPVCGSEVVIRRGRFGPFLGCSKYPECKGIVKIQKVYGPCPKCGTGELVGRRGGKGKRVFYGCNRYPDCDYTTNKKPEPAETEAQV